MNAPKNPPVQINPSQFETDRKPYETPNDEISLFDLLDYAVRIVDFMIRKRNLILSIAAVFTLISAIYALSITPKYKTTISFLMPQETFLPETFSTKHNTEYQKIIREAKISLYQKFLINIQSYNFQREVFDRGNFLEKFNGNSGSPVNIDAMVLEINKSISLKDVRGNKNKAEFNKPIFLELEGYKPEAMAEFLNALIKKGIQSIPIEEHLSNAIDQRLNSISTKKLSLKEKYENEIAQLKKELALARSMNVEENNFNSIQPHKDIPRWFLYGAKILEEELRELKSRAKNSDEIKTASFDMAFKTWESFKALKSPNVVVIDQPSIPPTQPISNKTASIIFTGLFTGLFFGSAFAFLQQARRNLNARRGLVSEINNKTKSFVFKHSSQTVS